METTKPLYLVHAFLGRDDAQRFLNEKAEEGYDLVSSFRTGEFTINLILKLRPEEIE